MWDIVISTLTGTVGGAIGSLLAPWATWGIEKKRIQQEARAKLIDDTRRMLANPPPNKAFRVSIVYSRLRPYLSEKVIEAVEGEFVQNTQGFPVEVVAVAVGSGRGSGVNPYAHQILDELTALEVKWDLI